MTPSASLFLRHKGLVSNTKEQWMTRRVFLLLGVSLVSLSLLSDFRVLMNYDSSGHSITTMQPFNSIPDQSTTLQRNITSTDSKADFNIFYNIFLPDDQEGIERGINIIKEQIGIIGSSYAGRSGKSTIVHYVTIGHDALNRTDMQEWCDLYGLICRHVKHYESGNEYLTLEHVRDYCAKLPPNETSSRVTYIHSKGSFHYNDFNELWRKVLTMAVVDEKCLRPNNETCNACGLQFYPLWTLFFPGNFWTASCSYINTLLPLIEYERKMWQVHEMIERSDKLSRNMFGWDDNVLGYGRYAAELWIGSGPSIIPCDVSVESDIWYWIDIDRKADEFEFAMAPRHHIIHDRRPVTRGDVVAQVVPNRSRYEYFLLGGHLIKWQALYGKLPDYNSWVWEFFPDGHEWLRDVMYGEFEDLYNTLMRGVTKLGNFD